MDQKTKLLKVMQQKKMSQRDLEAALKLGAGTVSRWLSGDRIPSLEAAFALQDLLKINARGWCSRKLHSKRSKKSEKHNYVVRFF